MNRLLSLTAILALTVLSSDCSAWAPPARRSASATRMSRALKAAETKDKETDPQETTEKFGLEAGIFESLNKKDGGESAKSLLKKYGIAYLATSIPLALVSFAICYGLVDSGVDVSSLLAKVGIQNVATEKAGTFAIAYAAHKAASPIRFPPTVILTPVVAKLIGKEPVIEQEDDSAAQE